MNCSQTPDSGLMNMEYVCYCFQISKLSLASSVPAVLERGCVRGEKKQKAKTDKEKKNIRNWKTEPDKPTTRRRKQKCGVGETSKCTTFLQGMTIRLLQWVTDQEKKRQSDYISISMCTTVLLTAVCNCDCAEDLTASTGRQQAWKGKGGPVLPGSFFFGGGG